MHKHLQFLVASLISLIIVVISVPLTTKAVFLSRDTEGIFENRAHLRAVRREYARAVERCSRDRSLGEQDAFCAVYWQAADRCLADRGLREDVGCPDINDSELLEAFEDGALADEPASAEPLRPSAPSSLQIEDLSPRDQAQLHRYERAHSCPASLREYIPGFYNLCKSLLGEESRDELIEGILNEKAADSMRRSAPATLKMRLQMTPKARPDR